jgi:hypothetical protein
MKQLKTLRKVLDLRLMALREQKPINDKEEHVRLGSINEVEELLRLVDSMTPVGKKRRTGKERGVQLVPSVFSRLARI